MSVEWDVDATETGTHHEHTHPDHRGGGSMTAVNHDRLYRLEARARADHQTAQQTLAVSAWTPEGIKEHYKSKVTEFEWDPEVAHSREDDLAVSVSRAIAADDVRAQAFVAVYDAHHATNPVRWSA